MAGELAPARDEEPAPDEKALTAESDSLKVQPADGEAVDPVEFFGLSENHRSLTDAQTEKFREGLSSEIARVGERFDQLNPTLQDAMLRVLDDLEHGLTRDQLRLLMELDSPNYGVVLGVLLSKQRERQMSLFTQSERDLVEEISDKLEKDGFFSLSREELEFARYGVGWELLDIELREAAKKLSGPPDYYRPKMAQELARMLNLNDDEKVELAFDLRRVNSAVIRDTTRIAMTLVRRDRVLHDREIKYARSKPYLREKLREYLERGVDQDQIKSNLEAKVDSWEAEIKKCQREMIDAKDEIAKDTKRNEELERRLARFDRSTRSSSRIENQKKQLEEEKSLLRQRVAKNQETVRSKQTRISVAMKSIQTLKSQLEQLSDKSPEAAVIPN